MILLPASGPKGRDTPKFAVVDGTGEPDAF
jgi:hypothetical protein